MPHIIVIGGPNGAGKSTIAPGLLRDHLGLEDFVNADDIARGLSAFAPESAAREAGRVMLGRLRELAEARADFAFETTLSSRSFAPWLDRQRQDGIGSRSSTSGCQRRRCPIDRISARVRDGGHSIPDDIARRRHGRSVFNFLHLYLPIADEWEALDNSSESGPRRIAEGGVGAETTVYDQAVWRTLQGGAAS